MNYVMNYDKKGAQILEMFCGESLIDLDKDTLPNLNKGVNKDVLDEFDL